MRSRLIIAMTCLTLWAVHAWAIMPSIEGTVVSLDRGTGTIIIKESGSQDRITIRVSPNRIPGAVGKGTTIKAWGSFTSEGAMSFRASRISTAGSPGSGKDPTGVRSRLLKKK